MLFKDSKLNSIAVWMSVDTINYILLVEYKENSLIHREKYTDSMNDLIRKLTNCVKELIQSGKYLCYKIQFKFDEGVVCYSSHEDNILSNSKLRKNVHDEEYKFNNSLYKTLSIREKQILYFLADEYTQSDLCNKLNIKLDTLKFHRKNIYRKMNFYSKAQLLRWTDKYLVHFFEQNV